MKYRIYAGLGGGATYQITEDYTSIDEALEDAYNLSVEEYQSYEGCHGIMSWEDLEESGFDYDDEAVDDRYQEELESWLSYYVEPEEE